MQINRRKFIQGATISLMSIPVLLELGCTKQQQLTLAQEANVIGTTAAAIATQLGNTALAQQLTTATNTAVGLITNWVPGSATTQVEQALTALLSVINLIPVAAPYVTLIDIIVAGIEGALALLPTTSAPATINPMVRHSFLGNKTINPKEMINNQINNFMSKYDNEMLNHPEIVTLINKMYLKNSKGFYIQRYEYR